MSEREVREQLYKALDQMELFELSNVVEEALSSRDLDCQSLYGCKDCEAEYGSCSDDQDMTADGQYICKARMYKHYGLQLA